MAQGGTAEVGWRGPEGCCNSKKVSNYEKRGRKRKKRSQMKGVGLSKKTTPEVCFYTRVRNVRQVSPFQRTNKIMRVDMLEMTPKKKEESFTQLCRFSIPTSEPDLITVPQWLMCQWWSWMTSLMQLIDRFRWCIGNRLSCYWSLINEWRPVSFEGASMKTIVFWTVSAESMKRALCSLSCIETSWNVEQKCHKTWLWTIPGERGLEIKTCNHNGTNVFILIQLNQETMVALFFYSVITFNQLIPKTHFQILRNGSQLVKPARALTVHTKVWTCTSVWISVGWGRS